jgi:hypothetical protein
MVANKGKRVLEDSVPVFIRITVQRILSSTFFITSGRFRCCSRSLIAQDVFKKTQPLAELV